VRRGAGGASIHLGGSAIDLGGIGKGLAVRWAAACLGPVGHGALVDAGGDIAVVGAGPDGGPWLLGVEDPAGGEEPVLVLALTGGACATSSIRRRRWRTAGGEVVHHLVDPRTGRPGGAGLAAVTVVADDPAWAEVWAKALFLAGGDGVGALATRTGIAAAWVGVEGAVTTSPHLDERVVWRR
jgi:thiamine biosynthesis lipoprotein